MNNPFRSINCVFESADEIRARCIDRKREVDTCLEALVEHGHNVLVHGTRGVGKTFLLRLVEDGLRATERFFPCFANLASLSAYGGPSDTSGFPRAVLLQLCASIWKALGKSYLDLCDRLSETGQEITFRKEAERTVQRV